MPSTRTSKRLLGTLVLTAILPMAAHAETITWNGASGGTWGTATNWDPEDVPDDATEEATFPSDGGALDVVLDRSIYLGSITQANPSSSVCPSRRGSMPLLAISSSKFPLVPQRPVLTRIVGIPSA